MISAPSADFQSWKSLNLLDCGLEDISPLANLKSLQWLDLAYNRIKDISALGGLVKLTGLHLDSNSIVDHTPIQAIYENLTDKDFAYGDVMLVPENPDAVVAFADPLFERMVREQIGMPEGPVTAKDAAKFDRLDFNLQWQESHPGGYTHPRYHGVEYFINLKVLSLNFHAVGDISMVPMLKRLEELDIGANGISDLSALAGMTGLTPPGGLCQRHHGHRAARRADQAAGPAAGAQPDHRRLPACGHDGARPSSG